MESWGRRKRSIGAAAAAAAASATEGKKGAQIGDDMTLSRELLVLDLKEKAAGEAGAGSGDSTGGAQDELSLVSDGFVQKAPLRSASQARQSVGSDETLTMAQTEAQQQQQQANLHCLTSHSLLLITGSIGLFFVLYVCLVAHFFARRDAKISVIKHQFH